LVSPFGVLFWVLLAMLCFSFFSLGAGFVVFLGMFYTPVGIEKVLWRRNERCTCNVLNILGKDFGLLSLDEDRVSLDDSM
jgi:hypothetical protein